MKIGAGKVGHRRVDGATVELGRPARHVPEQVGGERDVGRTGHAERLAVVQAVELRELVGVLNNQITDTVHDPTPFRGGHSAPRAVLEGAASSPHCAVDVLRVALGDACEHLTGSGINGVERLAASSLLELAIDEQRTGRRTEQPSALGEGDGNSHLVLLMKCVMLLLRHCWRRKVLLICVPPFTSVCCGLWLACDYGHNKLSNTDGAIDALARGPPKIPTSTEVVQPARQPRDWPLSAC